MQDDQAIATIGQLLQRARRVLFITGAGISADSGLPTYRGVGGLYNSGTTEEGMAIEDALSGEVFALQPEITWKYLAAIERNCRDAQPNAAHLAIAELERRLPYVLVLTQNIDGLHRAAGSRELIEIHGGLKNFSCPACDFKEYRESLAGHALPPRCPRCGTVLRTDVVLFGEALPSGAIQHLYEAMEDGFDLVFTIGTSAVFPYIVEPVVWALRNGIPTVEINPVYTQLSDHVDFYLPLGAAAAMRAILVATEAA
jgi:NAD-dependent deacetylase